jgi:hypothetical protein
MKNIVELGFRECRWAVGECTEEGQKFCAEETDPGEVYCPEHAARARPGGLREGERLPKHYRAQLGAFHQTPCGTIARTIGEPNEKRRAAALARGEAQRGIRPTDIEPDLCELFEAERL